MSTATAEPPKVTDEGRWEASIVAASRLREGKEREHVVAALVRDWSLTPEEAETIVGIEVSSLGGQSAARKSEEGSAAADKTSRLAPIRKALFEDAQSVWDAEGPPRTELPGGCGLIHEGIGVYGFGPRNGGKSIGTKTVELNMAMHGVKVLHLDRENAPPLARKQTDDAIAAVDAFDEATLREFFESRHYPHFDLKWKAEDYADAIAEAGFKVVTYDSVREVLNQLGLSSNSDDDWSELYALLGTPLIERGIAPIFLDNVGNKATQRPRGSAAKLDAVPQGFRIWSREMFSPEITGQIGIECMRSRYGDEDKLWTMTIGGGHWEVPSEDDAAEPITTTWGAVLAKLENGNAWTYQDLADAAGMTKRNIERLVRGNLKSEAPDLVKDTPKGGTATVRLKTVGLPV